MTPQDTRNEARPLRRVRLAYLVTHPIQYQAPLLRRIAEEPDIDLTVFYGSDFSVRGYRDEGFGVTFKWDTPLLDGYKHVFLPKLRDGDDVSFATPLNCGIVSHLRGSDGEPAFDALWVHGYATANALHGILAAKMLGIPVLLRADMWLSDRTRSPWKLLLKKIFFAALERMIDGVLPVGTLNAQYWHHYFGDHIPQFLMPYATDNAYFAQRSADATATRENLQRDLGLDPSRPVILFASKLQTRKHCNHLIEAYARLSPPPEAILIPTSSSSATAKSEPHSSSRPPQPASAASASAASATSLSCPASSISPPSSSSPRATSPGASSSTKSCPHLAPPSSPTTSAARPT